MEDLLHIKAARLRHLGVVEWGYTEEAAAASWTRFCDWNPGPLSYLRGRRQKMRADLKKFYPDFASALVFLFDYTDKRQALESLEDTNGLRMASYVFACGEEDYHLAIGRRLEEIASELGQERAGLQWQAVLDVHPVLERDLAWRSGLGWFGKNSMLISRHHGSFFLIGSLLFNGKLALATKNMETDHCGTCRACVDACPTAAIDGGKRQVSADKCISTFTIELFKDDAKPPAGYPNATGEIFGCDICQDVCPWNRPPDRPVAAFQAGPLADFFLLRPIGQIVAELRAMSGKKFARLFGKSALGRTGRVGLLKNLKLFVGGGP